MPGFFRSLAPGSIGLRRKLSLLSSILLLFPAERGQSETPL